MQIHNKNQNKNSIMQTKVYKTRVSILLILIVISVGILCQLPLIMNHAPKMAIISNSATMFFVLGFGIASIINIKYVIVNDTLRIYSFFWIHKDIKIDSIRKMEPSRSIISSPAGSLKRKGDPWLLPKPRKRYRSALAYTAIHFPVSVPCSPYSGH